ncbi:MAG: glycosyltransferase [Ginsengibacter sp.]
MIAPLDWGLGHATRCIPIICELISLNCDVFIAASGNGYFLLKKEFPQTVILRIRSYKIRYSRNKFWLPPTLILQIPKLVFSILYEHLWLKKITKIYNIDAVISDNRFGLYSRKIPSVFITHQLLIKTGNVFLERILQKQNYSFIKKFSQCWVPDLKENGFAGELSHPNALPGNEIFIGPLSRFEVMQNVAKKYDLLIALSGPEPQRTIFEKIIVLQLKLCQKKILFVRGLPGENRILVSGKESFKIVNHLSGDELNIAFQQSEIIICRSGYTTIMDLVKLGKSAILVPTPGQTEQEYLAHYLCKKKYFYSVNQQEFSIENVLKDAASFAFERTSSTMDGYKKVVYEFVVSLKSGKFANQ